MPTSCATTSPLIRPNATSCCCGSWARPTRVRSTASAAPTRSRRRSRSSRPRPTIAPTWSTCSCSSVSANASSPTARTAATCSPASGPSPSSGGSWTRADGEAAVRIHMINTDSIATAHFPVRDGRARRHRCHRGLGGAGHGGRDPDRLRRHRRQLVWRAAADRERRRPGGGRRLHARRQRDAGGRDAGRCGGHHRLRDVRRAERRCGVAGPARGDPAEGRRC